jgi:hypothetical protein
MADEWSKLPKDFPKDARAFMLRRLSCQHWAEEGFNPNNYPPAQIRRLKRQVAIECSTLRKDEVALRKHYALNAPVLRALSDSINWDPPQP